MGKIVVTGGAYEEREGISVELINGGIFISGWYDGGCPLDVFLSMDFDEFIKKLKEQDNDE